jgi:hypothetical protein
LLSEKERLYECDDKKAGRWVDQTLGALSLDQKIGQLLVFGFCGPVVTPDIEDLVRHHHLGGVRVSQAFRILNRLRTIAMEWPGAVPLHFAID